jgi:tRNA(Ile2)-agmatinylcytidine synthase
MFLHIGIDDTDSPEGGCTTYIAALLIERLTKLGIVFRDYPILLRLNPNAPWKTRGNASICIRIDIKDEIIEKAENLVIETVENCAEFDCENTNPGIVFHYGNIPCSYKEFSKKAVQSIVTLKTADNLIQENNANSRGYKNRRGIIGALAAIGGTLTGDHTYELLTYRTKENRGLPRKVDEGTVKDMDLKYQKNTFNNLDLDKKNILITPRGPDPVLYGIRGETAKDVHMASMMLKTSEPIERWVIFVSNQGTDAHLTFTKKISDLKTNQPGIIQCKVGKKPEIIRGGHVIFSVHDNSGEIDCAAYEPTGDFRKIVKELIPGDLVIAYGGINLTDKGKTLNLEKISVINLVEDVTYINPTCPKCGSRMESMGKEAGYRCKKCGYRDKTIEKERIVKDRKIGNGLYVVPPNAQRHLTKPLKRYGKEKNKRLKILYQNFYKSF